MNNCNHCLKLFDCLKVGVSVSSKTDCTGYKIKHGLMLLIAKLQAIKNGDPESGHREADTFLLDYIGNEDVTKAFESIRKWYA